MAVALGAAACGDGGDPGDSGAGSDAADEPSIDAGADAASDAALDVAKDVAKDVAVDTGTPPLACSGDFDEPNGNEILATPLGTIDDCDGSGGDVFGVSSGTGDVDWLLFHGSDTFGCSVDPTFQIDVAGARLCAFALCDDGTTTVQSCGSGTPTVSPAGTHGCCTTSTQSMKLQIACSGTNDSAAMFVRVDQPETNECVSYDVAYHY